MKRAGFWTLLLVAALAGRASAEGPSEKLTFEQHVRPIFKANCFQCHGEEGTRKGNLDLRLRRFIVAGGDSGAAVQAGKPEESLLIERLRAGEMPPGDKKLSAAQIATIVQWITQGAETARPEPEQIGDEPLFTEEERQYWAFQPIRRPPLPQVAQRELVRTPLDTFVLARLAAGGLSLSAEADARTLLRRAVFDLTGLPPTPEEIEAFLADAAPGAWERLIERLLALPQYGERWGRHWLDVAGYADSEGYSDEDTVREWSFGYRDYVIRAFNADKPFDAFIQEQLAGDELVPLPHANLAPDAIDKLTATGFLRMAPDGTGSGGIDQNVARNQVVADTLQIVSTALLGLTVNCAQCHDHRYDPIPQADYYRLRAVFEPALDWKNWTPPAARHVTLYTDADREAARQIELEAVKVDQERLQKAEVWIELTLGEELGSLAEELREPLRVAFKTPAADRTAEQKKLLADYPSVGNIRIDSLYLYDSRRDDQARKLDAERVQKEARFLAETKAAELAKVPEAERALVEAAVQAQADKRTSEQAELLAKYPGVLVAAATLSQFHPAAAAELKKDLDLAAELRSRKSAADLKAIADRAGEVRGRKPPENFIRSLTEPPGHMPVTFVFHRGDHEQPKQQVSPGDLSILAGIVGTELPGDDPQLPTSGRRLAFARHLTDGKHPLVARVIVNRIWLHHFGRGLVNSPGDFGVLGERPTHPELLDWLAAEFMEHGWSVKHLHRLIMNSAVYRQAATRRPELDSVDPENRLYGRASIRRLEAEIVRDAVLAVSGKLNDKLYGRPVPVMEDDVGQIVLGKENLDGERKPVAGDALGGEEHRRSIYVQVRRTRPLGVLETFDTPTMAPNCDCRSFSTVASQSLTFMNSSFVLEYAGHFATRVRAEAGPDSGQQVARAWLVAFGKPAAPEDLAAAAGFLDQQRSALRAQKPDAQAADVEQRTLTSFCQALLSANSFLYVD